MENDDELFQEQLIIISENPSVKKTDYFKKDFFPRPLLRTNKWKRE